MRRGCGELRSRRDHPVCGEVGRRQAGQTQCLGGGSEEQAWWPRLQARRAPGASSGGKSIQLGPLARAHGNFAPRQERFLGCWGHQKDSW